MNNSPLIKARIVGLGYCGLDYLSMVPEIPFDSKVEISQSLIQGGGPAATAIFTAACLGESTALISAVGKDERGTEIIAGLKSGGVYTDAIKERETGISPAAFCWTEEKSGKRSIAWTRGSVAPLRPEEINISLIESAKVLHLDGHHTEAAIHAAALARKNGVTVSLDAGTIIPGMDKLLGLSDIIIASEEFAGKFTGESNPAKSVKKLFQANCKFSAVTRGTEGCIGFDGKEVFREPALEVNVVDTTGAGDVFHGAFVYKLANGGDWQECVKFASAVSALKCTKFGGRTGIPTLSQANTFLQKAEQL